MSSDLSSHSSTDAQHLDEPDDVVEVRRDGPLSAVVGTVAAVLAVAYLLRATGSAAPVDWVLCALTTVIAALHLSAVVDARAPLMVLDHHGVRVRRGRTWLGVAWPEVARVEHRPRRSLLRDGSVSVVDVDGRVIAVRLSLSTRLVGADWSEVTEALHDLTEGRTEVVELDPTAEVAAQEVVAEEAAPENPEPEPEPVEPESAEPVAAAPAPAPAPTPVSALRALVRGRRSESVVERPEPVEPEHDDDATQVVPVVAASTASETATILIDEGLPAPEPVRDPVIGPQLAASRHRIGLTVDQLADRTRIRPHVIEAIEVDDFGPCGGDFYARGHLRTLARILGLDVAPLLATYDERYADAPIDPRRVFEAELATGAGGPIRGTRGRLNWSVLVASVMAVVLVWSVARLVMDGPAPVSDRPVLNGSPGGQKAALSGSTTKVPVTFTAATGGARVIVRDGRQQVVFDETLTFMQTAELTVVPPVRISSSDGGLTVTVDGNDEGALGATGQEAQRVYVP